MASPTAVRTRLMLIVVSALVVATSQEFATRTSAQVIDSPLRAQAAGLDPTYYLEPYVAYPVGSTSEAVAIGDLNHDGLNDVALVTSQRSSDPANDFMVFVFLQDAAGGLRAPAKYPTGATSSNMPYTIDVADLTGDGRADVVIGRDKHSLVVLSQNATGTLNPGVSYPTSSAHQLRIGDFNSDGRQDVASIARERGSVAIFTQQTTGRLALVASYPAAHQGESDIDVGDMNGDGRDDLLITSGWVEGPDVSVLLQQPGGLFDTVRAYDWVPDELPDAFAIGDLNGDGRDDVAFGHYEGIAVRTNGSGGLGTPTIFPTTRGAAGIEIADIDSDSRGDVIVATRSNPLAVYRQTVNGTLAAAEEFPIPGGTYYNQQSLAVGDVSGDGAADVVVASYSSGLVVFQQKPPQPARIEVSSRTTPAGHIQLVWTPYAGATSYEIHRRGVGGVFTLIGSSTTPAFLDASAAPNAAYMYRVRARGAAGTVVQSTFELATSVPFSDDPVVPGTTPLRAAHVAELRRAVTAVRALAGLYSLTFIGYAEPGAPMRASHITELRSALDPALRALSIAAPAYAEPVAIGGLIKASHIEELRARLR